MILPAQEIRRLGLVTPCEHRHSVRGATAGLGPAGYDVTLDGLGGWAETLLSPGKFLLLSTQEKFHMPPNVLGVVHDKSTWARRGVAVQNTVIEPGWFGYLTLEVTNHGTDELVFQEGDPIAQVVFHWLKFDTDRPYSGKYQNQERGPQGAR